jgi:outer membrane lipoprotein SlyB
MALMRKARFACLVLAMLAGAAIGAPLTNDDVVKMVRGGLSEATVIQAIDSAAEPAFDTSPDGLIRLKQGGVSEAVIQRMLARQGGAAAAPPCRECGVVEQVRQVEVPGTASGAGAVAGGVIGGAVGRGVSSDRHRTAGTVIGAVGGAVAGHQVEKHVKSGKAWEVSVRFDDASARVFR